MTIGWPWNCGPDAQHDEPLSTVAAADGCEERPDICVVVCAYTEQRWAVMCAAVRSVLAQEEAAAEVVLVIDHDDHLLDRARSEFPTLAVIPNRYAQGLSGARNTGVEWATAQIVGFLDDDAAAEPGWSAGLLNAFADPTVIGVGTRIEPLWQVPRPGWFPDEFLWVVGCSYTGLPQRTEPIRNPIGASMAFRREPVLAVGGFQSTLGRVGDNGSAGEETELAIRLRDRSPGVAILFAPDIVATHAVTADRVTRRYFRLRCRAEGRSKAIVADHVGPGNALSTERRYVARTIPAGILRGLGEAMRGDGDGLRRALTIVEGLAIVASHYFWTRARMMLAHPSVGRRSCRP